MAVQTAEVQPVHPLPQFEANKLDSLSWKYIVPLFSAINIINTTPLYSVREGMKKRPATLVDLAAMLELSDPHLHNTLEYHSRRITRYDLIQKWITFPLMYVLFFLTMLLIIEYGIPGVISLTDSLGQLLSFIDPFLLYLPLLLLKGVLIVLLFLLYYLIPFSAAAKVGAALTDRSFAESLSVYLAVCLQVQLKNDTVLQNPDSRRVLLYTMNDLAYSIQLQSVHYPAKAEETKNWVRQHFEHMAEYVRERQRWAVARRENTLHDLRDSFRWFSEVLIHFRYGDIHWPEPDPQAQPAQTRAGAERRGVLRRFVSGFSSLFGIIIPVGLLTYLISREDLLANFGLDPQVLSLITLAWSLIGLDKLLGLGVISSLVDITKGLKGSV